MNYNKLLKDIVTVWLQTNYQILKSNNLDLDIAFSYCTMRELLEGMLPNTHRQVARELLAQCPTITLAEYRLKNMVARDDVFITRHEKKAFYTKHKKACELFLSQLALIINE